MRGAGTEGTGLLPTEPRRGAVAHPVVWRRVVPPPSSTEGSPEVVAPAHRGAAGAESRPHSGPVAMSARFSRGLAVGLFLFLARAVHAELPAAPGPASEALRARCHADLERVIAEAVRFGATHRRAQELLAGLSTACEGVLPERLRDGAGRAASAR